MKPVTDFIQAYQEQFNRNDLHKTVFQLGDRAMSKKARVNMAFHKTRWIMDFVLSNKAVWIVLIAWKSPAQMQQEWLEIGFDLTAFDCYAGTPSDQVVDYGLLSPLSTTYLSLNAYDSNVISPLYKGILGCDLNIAPNTSARAYFISFDDQPIFLNPYDDRGLELLTPHAPYQQEIEAQFAPYLLWSTAPLLHDDEGDQ